MKEFAHVLIGLGVTIIVLLIVGNLAFVRLNSAELLVEFLVWWVSAVVLVFVGVLLLIREEKG